MAEHAQDPDQDQNPGLLARWRQTEPVRLHLYGIAVPLVALLMGYGLLSGHMAGLWLAVIAATLLGGGVEAARTWTVSPATAGAALQDAADGDTYAPDINPESVARLISIRYRIPR